MKALGDGPRLRWVESGPLETRLQEGDQTVASLAWRQPWGSLATAETTGGKWTLKRVGFLRPRVTVRQEGANPTVAIVTMSWGGDGIIDFSGGRSFRLRSSRAGGASWVLSDARGARLFVMEAEYREKHAEASVTFEKDALRFREWLLPLLILSWYVVRLMLRYDYQTEDITGALVATWG